MSSAPKASATEAISLRVTDEEAERLLTACQVLGAHDMEQRLLSSKVTAVRLFQSHTADTYEFYFDDDEKGSFKSIEGAARQAEVWGHTAASVVLNDVAAWLVGRALGMEHLLRGVVLTTCSHEGAGLGTLQHWFTGEPSGDGWEKSPHLRESALFDALIAHQDRHTSNFSYDSDTDELGLFDNSFAFALPGQRRGATLLLSTAYSENRGLGIDGAVPLHLFLESKERVLLAQLLSQERYERLMWRALEMEKNRLLLQPFDY